MRFYGNDHDYMADIRLLATNRFGQPHIQVFYNDRKVPVLKEWINVEGESLKQEFLELENESDRIDFIDIFLDSVIENAKNKKNQLFEGKRPN